MILFFQLPITDIRSFVSGYTGKIAVPVWPQPIFSDSNNKQDWFVRRFGKIKPRRKGGIKGWLGEDELCDAKSAIKIQENHPFEIDDHIICTQGKARHFFFDGQAVGKYEFVFTTTKILKLPSTKFSDFITHFLKMRVAPSHNKLLITPLHLAGANLAKEYLLSTTKSRGFYKLINTYWINQTKNHWVNSGSPVLFIELQNEETRFPANVGKETQVKKVQLPSEYGVDLFHVLHPIDNRFIRIWVLVGKDGGDEKLRALRLYIMRLNSEYESVKYVLSQIESGKIKYMPGQKENKLETFLNEATRHISKIENKARSLAETDEIEDLSKSSFDKVYPGSSDSILVKIKSMRPQVYRKVKTLVQEIYNVEGDYIMGDNMNFSGNFQGANLNVKSELKDVVINIQNSNALNQNTKNEIEKLIKQLDETLKKAPRKNKEDAEAVSATAKHLIETAIKEKPNKTEIKISADGLLRAAENIAKVIPVVLTIVNQLINLIVK